MAHSFSGGGAEAQRYELATCIDDYQKQFQSEKRLRKYTRNHEVEIYDYLLERYTEYKSEDTQAAVVLCELGKYDKILCLEVLDGCLDDINLIRLAKETYNTLWCDIAEWQDVQDAWGTEKCVEGRRQWVSHDKKRQHADGTSPE